VRARHRFALPCCLAAGAAVLTLTGVSSAAAGKGTLTPVRTQAQVAGDHAGMSAARDAGAQRAPMATVGAAAAAVGGFLFARGIDVASYQGNVNWDSVRNNGGAFTYVKATESTNYKNPYFLQQYGGSAAAGLVRGAYHFAIPTASSGKVQADYFVNDGGFWTSDGKTLPPMLDFEYNPNGPICYGLSKQAMAQWAVDFSNEVHARTNRYPIMYSTNGWWANCTGNTTALSKTNPFYVAHWAFYPGKLPGGWKTWKIWQYSSHGVNPGTQEIFHGNHAALVAFAKG
jgi:GH25 family lysozyme M1 (1,4-beta-N-acetylmuramidase)